jgi:hypothetical protein
MGIPRVNVAINKFLLSLPIQGIYIKYLLPLTIPNLKCMFHLQDINLGGRMHNRHGDHSAKGDIHACFPLQQHLVLIKDCSQIDFLLLNNLDSFVKGHAIHGLGYL